MIKRVKVKNKNNKRKEKNRVLISVDFFYKVWSGYNDSKYFFYFA